MAQIALGTAQFGSMYGIANRTGQINFEQGRNILARARQSDINTLDTAISYGDSETMLGTIGCSSWNVISKLPSIPEEISDISSWVQSEVRSSLERLKIPTLYGVLLHRPSDLLGPHGDALAENLLDLKSSGMVSKLGVSIYSPDELEPLDGLPLLDIVQAPMNIVDRGLASSGWLSKLDQRPVEIHTRSAFLQGLLVMSPAVRPAWLIKWSEIFGLWDAWISETGMSRIEACLAHVRSYEQIDQIVIGVDSVDQLDEILEALDAPPLRAPTSLELDDQFLINPSLWTTV
ncbi:MAG: aldo/keto reductase [Ilumatobacteraceae bacterium]